MAHALLRVLEPSDWSMGLWIPFYSWSLDVYVCVGSGVNFFLEMFTWWGPVRWLNM